MKSNYGLPLVGRCESHSCDESGEQCENMGKLFKVFSGTSGNTNLDDGHWEEYDCEIAQQINKESGFELVEVDDE